MRHKVTGNKYRRPHKRSPLITLALACAEAGTRWARDRFGRHWYFELRSDEAGRRYATFYYSNGGWYDEYLTEQRYRVSAPFEPFTGSLFTQNDKKPQGD